MDDHTWDLGNSYLYALCRDHPGHAPDEICAKIWLIGRAYAASIERRRTKGHVPGDQFYTEAVVPAIQQHPSINKWFQDVRDSKGTNVELLLRVHAELTKRFHEITHDDKRSLASKYLHFHFPDYYFIYDSRSVRAASIVRQWLELRRDVPVPRGDHDDPYAKFFVRCQQLRDALGYQLKRSVSPRQLDNLFLKAAEGAYGDRH